MHVPDRVEDSDQDRGCLCAGRISARIFVQDSCATLRGTTPRRPKRNRRARINRKSVLDNKPTEHIHGQSLFAHCAHILHVFGSKRTHSDRHLRPFCAHFFILCASCYLFLYVSLRARHTNSYEHPPRTPRNKHVWGSILQFLRYMPRSRQYIWAKTSALPDAHADSVESRGHGTKSRVFLNGNRLHAPPLYTYILSHVQAERQIANVTSLRFSQRLKNSLVTLKNSLVTFSNFLESMLDFLNR